MSAAVSEVIRSTRRASIMPTPHPNPSAPDTAWIRAHVPISDVASELGIPVFGNRARCWRDNAHTNGDGDPSIRFDRRKNRLRCFVCDDIGGHSVFDLVMLYLGCDFSDAVAWICQRFPVPTAGRGKHVAKRESWRPAFRVGVAGSQMEWVVRSCLWASLTPSQRSVLQVLDTFTDRHTGICEISYRGIARFAGLGSATSVASAIVEFGRIHLLTREHRGSLNAERGCNRYRLDFDNPEFVGLVNSVSRRNREEIERERAFRAERRASHSRHTQRLSPVKATTVSTKWSDLHLVASSSEARGLNPRELVPVSVVGDAIRLPNNSARNAAGTY
jgi:hypothetical protein